LQPGPVDQTVKRPDVARLYAPILHLPSNASDRA
jgi:hypothetical protein